VGDVRYCADCVNYYPGCEATYYFAECYHSASPPACRAKVRVISSRGVVPNSRKRPGDELHVDIKVDLSMNEKGDCKYFMGTKEYSRKRCHKLRRQKKRGRR